MIMARQRSALAFAGGLFHLINNTLYKSGLFLASAPSRRGPGRAISTSSAAGEGMPRTFVAALVSALAISGIRVQRVLLQMDDYQGLLEKASSLSRAMPSGVSSASSWPSSQRLTLASFMKFLHAIFLGQRRERCRRQGAPANQWLATARWPCFASASPFGQGDPLKIFVMPAARRAGLAPAGFLGIYDPRLVLLLFGLASSWARRLRPDPEGALRPGLYRRQRPVRGFPRRRTEFYRRSRRCAPQGSTRPAAKKASTSTTSAPRHLRLSHLFQKAHGGLLQVYVLFILFGVLLFMVLPGRQE